MRNFGTNDIIFHFSFLRSCYSRCEHTLLGNVQQKSIPIRRIRAGAVIKRPENSFSPPGGTTTETF